MRSGLPRAAGPRTEAGSLQGSGPASCTASGPRGPGAGRREGQAGANGLFCSVSCNRAPARLSDTCGVCTFLKQDLAGLPTVTAVPSLPAPGRCFQLGRPLWGQLEGGSGLGRLISGTSALLGVLRRPEDLLVALREDLRIQTLVSAPGCRLAPYGHPLWNSLRLHGNNQPSLPAALHVL